jgi:hypothetical protein
VRHRVRPSFTVETKRASKRSLKSVASPQNERGHRENLPFVRPAAATEPPPLPAPERLGAPEARQPRVRRVLPDLTSVAPVQPEHPAGDRQAANGRRATQTARRRTNMRKKPLERGLASNQGVISAVDIEAVEEAAVVSGDVPATRSTSAQPVVATLPRSDRKHREWSNRATCRRAERRGQKPELPPGTRWKRRLPLVCR